jgi:hypothetical protein
MTLKLAALLLLWALFFSGAHRSGPERAAERIFGPEPASQRSSAGAQARAQPAHAAPAAHDPRND